MVGTASELINGRARGTLHGRFVMIKEILHAEGIKAGDISTCKGYPNLCTYRNQ